MAGEFFVHHERLEHEGDCQARDHQDRKPGDPQAPGIRFGFFGTPVLHGSEFRTFVFAMIRLRHRTFRGLSPSLNRRRGTTGMPAQKEGSSFNPRIIEAFLAPAAFPPPSGAKYFYGRANSGPDEMFTPA